MKKRNIKIILFFTLIISISLFIGCFWGYNLKENDVNLIVPQKNNPTVITVEATENTLKEYIELSDYNIYTYGLDHLMIFKNNNLVELKNYLPKHLDYIDELISNLNLEKKLNDGEILIYVDTNDYTNNGLSLVKCNTYEKNKDIYIGPRNMEIQETFCQNQDNTKKTFTKTYEVLNVAPSNSDEFIYLTLRQFQYEEVETVKVLKSLNYDINVSKNYEFTFEYNNEDIEDNIKSIFNNATLISIVETDKVGLEQTQDSIK